MLNWGNRNQKGALKPGGKFLSFLFSLLLLGSIPCFAMDVGTHRIPQHVNYAGTPIEPGMYLISIVEGPEGSYLQLSQNGKPVAKDLAIVIPARSPARQSTVEIASITGQEFLRIRVRSGDNWYYAYLERK